MFSLVLLVVRVDEETYITNVTITFTVLLLVVVPDVQPSTVSGVSRRGKGKFI